MAPTGVTDRASSSKSHGLHITSAVVKKGRPTVVKYSWTYDPKKSPEYFDVAVFNVATKDRFTLDEGVVTRGHGKDNTGTFTVDISFLEKRPGKYLLLFTILDREDYRHIIAKSKPFTVKKSDFYS